MPAILDVNFGREFFGWAQALEKQGQKIRYQIRHQNSLRNSTAIFLNFAGPKQEIHPKSALHNVGTSIASDLRFAIGITNPYRT